MNNEGLKKSNHSFLYMRRWFNFFESLLLRKYFVLVCFHETLTNYGDFIGNRIRISNSGGTSKRIGNLISAFEKADSEYSACDFE
jgi:hypothetical protein